MTTAVSATENHNRIAASALPPGTHPAALSRTPRRHRRDCLQEAWLGYLAGRNPRTVAKAYLDRELLHERREPTFTKLLIDDPDGPEA